MGAGVKRTPTRPWEIRNERARLAWIERGRKAWVARMRAPVNPEVRAMADFLTREAERLMGPSTPERIEEFRRFSALSAAEVALQKEHHHVAQRLRRQIWRITEASHRP